MKKKLPLSLNQVKHLIGITIRNAVDLVGRNEKDGYRFVVLLDCLNPEECIPHNQMPETEEEQIDIMCAHRLMEISPFLANLMSIRREGKSYRGVETVTINNKNFEDFLEALDDLDSFWEEALADDPVDLTGKNLIEGNGTVQ